jgi:hypothetical protein
VAVAEGAGVRDSIPQEIIPAVTTSRQARLATRVLPVM